ncbi:hypothetical protein E1B28_007553 [Marasmius oreades]|uniref:Uncharacterized protein n=1 Tax=Marasmius oreades TaxID=181124 RepID=A0A9P7UTK4_9AGAR|nr:uncharacterized protein E1B28_007553 [Marasmius oreades]KAG7093917.1 hypothetical protein E1B28_007553 [Marasmius oreades]
MAAEQNRIAQEKDLVLSQLQTTETDMEDVKQQLLTYKKENRELENELRVNAEQRESGF